MFAAAPPRAEAGVALGSANEIRRQENTAASLVQQLMFGLCAYQFPMTTLHRPERSAAATAAASDEAA